MLLNFFIGAKTIDNIRIKEVKSHILQNADSAKEYPHWHAIQRPQHSHISLKNNKNVTHSTSKILNDKK